MSVVPANSSARVAPRATANAAVVTRSTLLLGAVVTFMIAPKIDVISVLRVEDIVFLLTLPVLIWSYRPGDTHAPAYFNWYVAYLAIGFVSALVNYGNVGLFGAINVLRPIQYMIWFLIGAQMARGVSEERFRKGMSVVALVLILWWIGEASGALPKIGKFTGASGRLTLNTSGPYETAVVVAFLLIFVRNRVLQIGLIGILFATQSRITLATAVAVYLAFNLRKSVVFAIPVAFLAGGLILIAPDMLLSDRLAATAMPFQMWQAFLHQIEASPTITSLGDYEYFGYTTVWNQIGQNASDASFTMRTIRWGLIIKSLQSDWLHLLLGWGPGAWGAAVDGHFIRFLGETGLIGLTTALMFMWRSALSTESPRPYKIAMAIMIGSALFIDVFTSSKAMSFLWVIFGYSYNRPFHLARLSGIVKNEHTPRVGG